MASRKRTSEVLWVGSCDYDPHASSNQSLSDLRRAGSHSPAVAASRRVCPDGCKFRFSLAAHARHAAVRLPVERSSLSAARGNRQEASRVMDAWVAPGPV